MNYENATTLTFCPGRLDEAAAILREHILPILRQQPGMLSLAVIPIAAEGQLTILSIWQTRAQARAIESDPAYCQAFHRLDGLLQEPAARPEHN